MDFYFIDIYGKAWYIYLDNSVSGMIFDIQRYCLHDGPGIRTIVFLKGCPLSCLWCSNPESQSFEAELFYNHTDCIGCGSCSLACDTGALLFDGNDPGLRYNAEKCRHCFACSGVCAAKALSITGYSISVDKLVVELEKDRCFFSESGGGATLSGGEPLIQAEFAIAILKRLKERGINTCIETCAYVSRDVFEEVIPFTDYFYFDIKHTNTGRNIEFTGADPEIALKNLELLISKKCNVTVRIPVIPGFNYDMESMGGIAAKLSSMGVKEVNLLPFHQFGKGKYASLFRKYAMDDVKPLNDSDVRMYKKMFNACNINAKIGG